MPWSSVRLAGEIISRLQECLIILRPGVVPLHRGFKEVDVDRYVVVLDLGIRVWRHSVEKIVDESAVLATDEIGVSH